MMMSCDKKFLLKCQQCLVLRLLFLPLPTLFTCVLLGGLVFSRYFSYHIPNLFDRDYEQVVAKG